MTLQQLKYIVTVADCGNITEAGGETFYFPAVFKCSNITTLKMKWVFKAFVRSNKGVAVDERRGRITYPSPECF